MRPKEFIGVKVQGRVDTSSSQKLEDAKRVQLSPQPTIGVKVLKDQITLRKLYCSLLSLVSFTYRSSQVSEESGELEQFSSYTKAHNLQITELSLRTGTTSIYIAKVAALGMSHVVFPLLFYVTPTSGCIQWECPSQWRCITIILCVFRWIVWVVYRFEHITLSLPNFGSLSWAGTIKIS